MPTEIETKEWPIRFNTAEVKAALAGQKTQTRRVIKTQPPSDKYKMILQIDSSSRDTRKNNNKYHWAIVDGLNIVADQEIYFKCPYGKVGDQLWVRETFFYEWQYDTQPDDMRDCKICYKADGQPDYMFDEDIKKEMGYKWTPSIHMPRWASRILLEITDIRVERVQEISKDDAKREGFEITGKDGLSHGWKWNNIFRAVWNSINTKRGYSWESNPFVWVIKFRQWPERSDE